MKEGDGALSQALANLKGTASVELAGEAKRAAAAKPEALVLWAQDEARCRRNIGFRILQPRANHWHSVYLVVTHITL